MPELLVKRLDPGLPLPHYARPGDAGLDLYAATEVTIAPGERVVIGSGVAVAVPDGFVGLASPRSGSASRDGLSIVNSPGVIDSGYRGEVKLILVNLDLNEPIEIKRGDRVAQLLVVPVSSVDVVELDDLPASERGDRGHGSTGR